MLPPNEQAERDLSEQQLPQSDRTTMRRRNFIGTLVAFTAGGLAHKLTQDTTKETSMVSTADSIGAIQVQLSELAYLLAMAEQLDDDSARKEMMYTAQIYAHSLRCVLEGTPPQLPTHHLDAIMNERTSVCTLLMERLAHARLTDEERSQLFLFLDTAERMSKGMNVLIDHSA